MKFLIDSANINEILSAQEMGVLDGVTTNPSLIAKEIKSGAYQDFMDHIIQICEIVRGPVSAEVTSLSLSEMIEEGEQLSQLHSNVTVKCPLTENGIRAIKHLSSKGIKTNATLIFSPTQALLAAKAGATMVSPFIGRLDDISFEGVKLVEQISKIFHNYNISAKILAASIRNPVHVIEVALIGADMATMPLAVMKQLFRHPLTSTGLEKFMEDAKVVKKIESRSL